MARTAKLDEQKIVAELSKLSGKGKKEAADFISFLKAKEELEATKEILSDSDFVKSIQRGEQDLKAGRVTKWSQVREDV